MEIKNAEGKMEKAVAQLQIRPVELYEIVFPEEHEAVVMGLIKPATDINTYGKKWGSIIKFFVKRLGLNPAIKEFTPSLLPPNSGVTALALGTKNDKVNWERKPGPHSFLDKGNTPRENL